MPVNELLYHDRIVSSLRYAVQYGNTGLNDVPGLLKKIIKENMWQDREISETGETVHFDRFMDFVQAKPLEGLGTDIKTINRLCADDPEAQDLIDRVTVDRPGAPVGNTNASKTNSYNITVCLDEPERGTSKEYALRRLRWQRPDLHEKVLNREISANAAMVVAGFRDKTVNVPLDPNKAAKAILRNFRTEDIATIIALLVAATVEPE